MPLARPLPPFLRFKLTVSQRLPRRRVDGILLVDKPAGLSSNAALQRAKRAYRAEKAGHAGTLDPLATGLLPVCFGEATKFVQALLDAPKRYLATIRFGTATATGDAEGEVVSSAPVAFDRPALERALASFIGTIAQRAPLYSALKRDGRPYYAYARAGQDVDRGQGLGQLHRPAQHGKAGGGDERHVP